ncbi:MAG: FtsX-like permease family protein [Anaeromassilibacillus sp.]|nr:FtsX-like permease family protein [Anaeromassilibacillus sp.]MDY3779234.1 FtsX-like permease family protein [Candidatus Limousia pullorum]
MKKALVKDLFREIWRTKSRFLAILAIVAIGCGFFAGVKSSCPDMKLTAATYYEEYNLADFHIMSNYGLDDTDIEAIKETVNVRGISGGYSADVMVKSDDKNNLVLKAISYDLENPDTADNMNRPLLIEGRLPEKSGECVVEQSKLANGKLAIGSKIQLYLEKDDISESLKVTEYEIVGTINTPSYVGFQYGTTTVGDGEIDTYILIPEEDFAFDVYTDVYLTLQETEGLDPFEDEYGQIIEEDTTLLENNDKLTYNRYNDIVAEAQEELDDAKQELADGEAEAEEKLNDGWQELEDARIQLEDAKTQIDDARQELDDGWSEYYSGIETLNTEIANGRQQIEDAKAQLYSAEAEYNSGLEQYNQGLAEFQEKEAAALEELSGYEAQLAELESVVTAGRQELDSFKSLLSNYKSIIEKYSAITVTEEEILPDEIAVMDQIDAFIAEMMPGVPISIKNFFVSYATAPAEEKQQYSAILSIVSSEGQKQIDEKEPQVIEGEEAVAQLKAGIEAGYSQLEAGRQELQNSKNQLDSAKQQIDDGYNEIYYNESLLNQKEAEGKQKLENALAKLYSGEADYDAGVVEYEDGLAEYQDGVEEYEQSKIDVEEELQEGRDKIADAEKELKDLETPEWYVFDRNDNPGYSTYEEDAEKVDAIAAVFPFFFVLVAALVCSTTMTRMVEEQRTQMGTLKALGYNNRSIVSKYLIYAISASIVGSIIGLCIGFKLFPWVIINAYKIMYSMPDPMMPFRWDYAGWCTLVGILCTGLSAYFVCRKELKTVPAQLMRPKAPKVGKKIMLERVGFVWNKLSFLHKVTARNIFRYKARSLMTTIGIAGCCALILTGFGLNYAISSIVDRQFEDIFKYDVTIAISENTENLEELQDYINSNQYINSSETLMVKTVDAEKNGETISSVSMSVLQNPEVVDDYITLRTMDDHTPLELTDDGVIISQKMSNVLKAKAGDSFSVVNSDGSKTELTVTGVTENYALNYIYMTPTLYREVYGEEPSYNMIYANIPDGVETSDLSTELLDDSDILGIAYSSDTMGRFVDTIGSLKSIVIVLIVSAGLLAFIVMYNLVNINVNERKRELATIKVLGFYDREVSSYIYRENNVAVLFGIILGLILGIFLEKFVVSVAEVDAVMFISDMAWWCYAVSALITAIFALIVTIVVHFSLKKIDMVESLKAIE